VDGFHPPLDSPSPLLVGIMGLQLPRRQLFLLTQRPRGPTPPKYQSQTPLEGIRQNTHLRNPPQEAKEGRRRIDHIILSPEVLEYPLVAIQNQGAMLKNGPFDADLGTPNQLPPQGGYLPLGRVSKAGTRIWGKASPRCCSEFGSCAKRLDSGQKALVDEPVTGFESSKGVLGKDEGVGQLLMV